MLDSSNVYLNSSNSLKTFNPNKSLADRNRKPMEFQVGDIVMLEVSPWKGVTCFGKRRKLNPRYIGPFKVLAKVGTVAYRLEILDQLSRVHSTFYVSNLKKCYVDEPLAISLDEIQIDDKLNFIEELVEIMDCEVKQLKQSHILIVKLEEFQDDWMKVINDKFDRLYADFVEMALHLEEKFHLHLFTTISGPISKAIEKGCPSLPSLLTYLGIFTSIYPNSLSLGRPREMDIFAFIYTPDPTKVRIVERERNEGEAQLLDTTIGRTVPLFPVAPNRADSELKASVERLFDEGGIGIQTEQGDSAGGEPNANIQLVIEAADIDVKNVTPVESRRKGKRKSTIVDAGGASHPPKKLRKDHETPSGTSVDASVSTTPEREGKDHIDSVTEPNLHTIGAQRRFFISLDSSHHSSTNVAEAEVNSLVAKEKLVEPSPFGAGSSSTGGTDPTAGVFSDLTSSDFLVAAIPTRQMSLSAEVRMHVEYNVKEKRRLKSVVERHDELLNVREEVIESLKARLLLREAKAAEAIRLRAELFNFETVEKSPRDETNALKKRNIILEKERNALDVKVIELETSVISKERELTDLNTLLEEFQDDWMKVINDKFDRLYADFVEMALHLKEKLHPHLLTIIYGHRSPIGKAIEKGMQDGLAVGSNFI
nr:putative reverse transcriptase domain-containing protein [Tanacetum cinerariifolium]